MTKERSIGTLPLDGGSLCFNFINTVYAWQGPNLHEYLSDYNEFLKWCHKVNLFSQAALKQMQYNESNTKQSDKVMSKILETRHLLYNFFSAVAAQHYGRIKELLPFFNKALAEGMSHLGFLVKNKQLMIAPSPLTLDRSEPLWLIMKSAYDMLTIENVERIKECPKCGWIFLDQTKNAKRRWCSPNTCGSTDKMKRYYLRNKKGG